MFDHNDRWNPSLKYDWDFIKSEWRKYWDTKKAVLLEKSPPNIMRAKEIASVFSPSYFVCMVRNPYACCERKKRMGGSVIEAAESVVMQLKYQRKNIEDLDDLIFFIYEDLTDKTGEVKEVIVDFISELKDIDIEIESKAHNILNKKMKIKNLNYLKIKRLTQKDFKDINSIFNKNKDILSYFKYEIIEKI